MDNNKVDNNKEETEVKELLISSGEVASMLGVTVQTVLRWVKMDLIDSILLPSGHRRFRKSDIDIIKNPPDKDKKTRRGNVNE